MRLHIPVSLRWSDLDAFAHVNNVEMLRLFENARITAFWRDPAAAPEDQWPTAVLDAGPATTTQTVVAHQEIEYLRPLGYSRTPVRVELWIGHLGGASVLVCYELHDGAARVERVGPASGADPYARAASTLVGIDAARGTPRRMTDAQRAAWQPFVEEPVVFRHRTR